MQRSVIPPWRFRGRGPRAAAECSALITHEILVREEEIKKERGEEEIKKERGERRERGRNKERER